MAITQRTRIDNGDFEDAIAELIASAATMEGRVATVQAASVAGTVGALVTDFNALLTKLKTAGLMASS